MQVQEIKKRNQTNRFVQAIQPNTTRVIQMRRKREQEQRRRRQMQEKIKQEHLKQAQKKQFQSKKQQLQEERRKKLRQLQQQRRIDQQNQSSKLSGRFGHMINDLRTNCSNLQFTISGLDLRPTQIKVLVNNVQSNASLKALSMTRKKITDIQGKDIVSKLQTNQVLERLQLQGNQLGPRTLQAVAKLLQKNKTLRSIDLEGNKLLVQFNQEKQAQKNLSGLKHLVNSLKTNQTLLWLNLYNTGLDQECSKYLRQIFVGNSTIIHIDIEGNPDMAMQDVKYIQDCLQRNKQQYYQDRLNQFHQRKRMKKEQDISHIILLNKQTKRLNQQAIEQNINFKKQTMDKQWNQFISDQQTIRQKMMVKMEKQAKKKKRRRKR